MKILGYRKGKKWKDGKCFANAHQNKAGVGILILDKVGFETRNIASDKKDIPYW